MADSLLGYGTTIGYNPVNSPSGTAFTILATALEVTPPKTSVDEVECTLLSNTNKDYVPALPEFECEFKLRLDQGDAGVLTMQSAIQKAPVPVYGWQIMYADGSNHTFNGFVKSYEPDAYTPGELRTATIGIRMKTAAVFNPAPTS